MAYHGHARRACTRGGGQHGYRHTGARGARDQRGSGPTRYDATSRGGGSASRASQCPATARRWNACTDIHYYKFISHSTQLISRPRARSAPRGSRATEMAKKHASPDGATHSRTRSPNSSSQKEEAHQTTRSTGHPASSLQPGHQARIQRLALSLNHQRHRFFGLSFG